MESVCCFSLFCEELIRAIMLKRILFPGFLHECYKFLLTLHLHQKAVFSLKQAMISTHRIKWEQRDFKVASHFVSMKIPWSQMKNRYLAGVDISLECFSINAYIITMFSV